MKSPRYTEDTLMKQFNEGRREALNRIYDMWFANLCYFAYRLTGNLGEAEDITVTTLQILLSRHEQFATMANVKAFLYITVRNKCLDYLRYKERQNTSHKEAVELQGEAEDFVLAQMIKTELLQEIYQEIEKLPVKRKEVFKLFYLEGLDIGEIARKLHMSPGAVSTTKSRALEQLRNMVFQKKLLRAIAYIVYIRELYVLHDNRFFN